LYKKYIKVFGSGPTGSLLAIALASKECNVVLIEPLSDLELLAKDKGYAITQCTRKIFKEIGIWHKIEKYAEGFTTLAIIDDVISQSVLIKDTDLKALNKDQSNIGWVVEHKHLMQLLIDQINCNKFIKKLPFDSTSNEDFDFILAADGRESSARKRWKINYFKSFYKQNCISFKANINGLPNKRAYEIFKDEGPLALLPLSNNNYQVIWFSSKSATELKLKLSKRELLDRLSINLPVKVKPEKIIGNISTFATAKAFALTKFTKLPNILVGDAAHSFHPVGGQGLNSCIRDVYELSLMIKNYENLSFFTRKFFGINFFLNRSVDIISLITFTDFLIKFFSNKFKILYPFRYLIFQSMKKMKFIRKNVFSIMTDSIKRYKFKNNENY
tara:strand:- start:1937 stop:3097 length:1161 start_codon:yes stop_codon:yes gene_type:complete